ncbi:MAG: hypothetical protein QOI04_430 [Verrucomicrobiota bacterium]|jgi:hypothetical protein
MNCLRFLVICLSLSLSLGTVFAQEAVVEPTPIIPSQEKAKEQKVEAEPEPKKEAAPATEKKSIRDTMTPEEFKAAGLDKLSKEELRNLDAKLQGNQHAAETKAAAKATKEATAQAEVDRITHDIIFSRVDGTFHGITGRTVIKLENGTVWKQAMPSDHFPARVTDHPRVAVLHDIMFGYKMRVEGTHEFYVDPVRK